MYTIAFSLIACGCTFNCCAIAFLILDKRKRDLQKKILQKNLEDIDYHLHRARTEPFSQRMVVPCFHNLCDTFVD
jgi:hypothetical protein